MISRKCLINFIKLSDQIFTINKKKLFLFKILGEC